MNHDRHPDDALKVSLSERLSELEAELQQLRSKLGELEGPEPSTPLATARMSRGGLLRTAGMLAAGAAAGAVAGVPAPALAANGLPVIAGQNTTATSVTSLSGSVLTDATLRTSNYYSGPFDDYSDAFQAYTFGAGLSAVYGRNDASGGAAVTGYSGSGLGASFSGGLAPVRLQPAGTAGAPTSLNHQQGELYVDSAGALWICTQSGTFSTVGAFQQLATTSGTYHSPSMAQFAWVNQGGATAVGDATGIYLQAPPNGGDSWRALVKSAPATPYEVRVALVPVWRLANYDYVGLVLRNSVSGKFVTAGMVCDGGVNFNHSTWNSPTSFNGHYNQFAFNVATPLWLRVKDDGTTRFCGVSSDGANWIDFITSGHSDFMVADQVGFGINSNSNASPLGIRVLSYEER